MTIELTFNPKARIIEGCIKDSFDSSALEILIAEISKFILEKQCKRILIDFREGKLDLATLTLPMIPEKLAEEFHKHGIPFLALKRALVIDMADMNYLLMGNQSESQKKLLKIFVDIDSAREWLIE